MLSNSKFRTVKKVDGERIDEKEEEEMEIGVCLKFTVT
jgi:hypothetical protein